MDAAYYHEQFAIEDSHWWYLGRRHIISRLLKRFRPVHDTNTLEVGCGGGGNLAMLARPDTDVTALEMESDAVDAARTRRLGTIWQGKLGDDLPPLKYQYDVLALFDVLEHIPDDAAALDEVRALLAPAGRAFFTVPAYGFLWTQHDVVAHHYRRYTRRQLIALLRRHGFRVVYASYFNTLLFPVACITLLVSRLFSLDPGSATQQPAGPINAILAKLFRSEGLIIPRWRLPFGLSIAVVAEKDSDKPD